MNHLKQFQKEEDEKLDKEFPKCPLRIYGVAEESKTEFIFAKNLPDKIKSFLHQRDERLISLLKSQIEALKTPEREETGICNGVCINKTLDRVLKLL